MFILDESIKSALETFQRLRMYKPFEYSGTWYASELGGNSYFYRSKKSLKDRARKLGLTGNIELYTIGVK